MHFSQDTKLSLRGKAQLLTQIYAKGITAGLTSLIKTPFSFITACWFSHFVASSQTADSREQQS